MGESPQSHAASDGLTDAVLCPGSRNAPLSFALGAHPRVTLHTRIKARYRTVDQDGNPITQTISGRELSIPTTWFRYGEQVRDGAV